MALFTRKPRKYGNPGVWGTAGATVASRAPAAARPTPQAQQPSMYQSAQKIAEMQIQAMLEEVRRQQETARAQADLEAQRELAKGQAVAYGLQQLGIAPQVQNIFNTAGQNIAGLAQGFSGVTRDQAAAQAAEQQRLLAGTGQENAVRNEGAAMGNVTYGTGGFIPGNELVSQGAGFSAQAALQPGFATQFGQVAEAERRRQWASELMDWANKRADVIGKKPALFQDALQNERAWDTEQYGRWKDQREYDHKIALEQANALLASNPDADLRLVNYGDGSMQWYDQNTGQPVGTKFGSVKPSDPNVYTDAQGRSVPKGYRYNANGELVKIPTSSKGGKSGKGGVSANTYSTRKKEAGKLAEVLYWGDEDKGIAGVDYQTALRRLGAEYGLRLADAQKILNNYWKPGEDGRPYLSYQQRAALRRKGVAASKINKAMWDEALAAKLLRLLG